MVALLQDLLEDVASVGLELLEVFFADPVVLQAGRNLVVLLVKHFF